MTRDPTPCRGCGTDDILDDATGLCITCHIRRAVGDDPFPLLEEVDDPAELPTVAEWLAAGAPMRDVTDGDA